MLLINHHGIIKKYRLYPIKIDPKYICSLLFFYNFQNNLHKHEINIILNKKNLDSNEMTRCCQFHEFAD